MSYAISKIWPFEGWKRKAQAARAIGWAAIGVNIIAAATYNPFAKLLTDHLSSLSLLLLSEVLSALFILMSFGAVPILKALASTKKKDILPLLWIGLATGAAAPLLWFSGVHNTTAVNSTLFTTSEMVFLILLAVPILHERFTGVHLLSVLTISLGIFTIALRGFSDGLHFQGGDLLLLASGFLFSSGSIVFRRFLHKSDPQVVLFVRSATGVMAFFLLSPFFQEPLIQQGASFPWAQVLPVLLGFAFISRFLNSFSFFVSIERLPVGTVSLMSNLSLVVGIALSCWLLQEPIETYHIVGGAFVILGTLMLEMVGVHWTPRHVAVHVADRKLLRRS